MPFAMTVAGAKGLLLRDFRHFYRDFPNPNALRSNELAVSIHSFFPDYHDLTVSAPAIAYAMGMTFETAFKPFILRLDDRELPARFDYPEIRTTLEAMDGDRKVVVEGLMRSPLPRVIGTWTPPECLLDGELPGYVVDYRSPSARSAAISIPRIQPFSQLKEWRDAVIRAAEQWATTVV